MLHPVLLPLFHSFFSTLPLVLSLIFMYMQLDTRGVHNRHNSAPHNLQCIYSHIQIFIFYCCFLRDDWPCNNFCSVLSNLKISSHRQLLSFIAWQHPPSPACYSASRERASGLRGLHIRTFAQCDKATRWPAAIRGLHKACTLHTVPQRSAKWPQSKGIVWQNAVFSLFNMGSIHKHQVLLL